MLILPYISSTLLDATNDDVLPLASAKYPLSPLAITASRPPHQPAPASPAPGHALCSTLRVYAGSCLCRLMLEALVRALPCAHAPMLTALRHSLRSCATATAAEANAVELQRCAQPLPRPRRDANMPPQPCLQMPTTPCGRKARTVGFGARFTYRRNAYGRVLRSHVLETVGRLPVGLSTHITIGSAISGPMRTAYTPPAGSAKHTGSAAERPLHAALLAFVRAPVGTAVIGTAEMRR